jgi:hypothetical protein
MSWSEIECSGSKSVSRLAYNSTSRKMAVQFSKSKKCLLFPVVPSWAVSKILRTGSMQQSGGFWNFITNDKFIRHARNFFPKCDSSLNKEIESLTSATTGCSDSSMSNTPLLDEFECLDIDCSGSCGLQRMAVCYQNWSGGDVMICVQYQGHDDDTDSCFLYSNVPLNRILQIIQSPTKSIHLRGITEDAQTLVTKLPGFPRCTDTPMTVGRSSPLPSNSFQPISP